MNHNLNQYHKCFTNPVAERKQRFVSGIYQNIHALHISMDEVILVQVLEAQSTVPCHAHSLQHGQGMKLRLLVKDSVQVSIWEILHHNSENVTRHGVPKDFGHIRRPILTIIKIGE